MQKAGFTLLELMIVLLIMGLMLGLLSLRLNTFTYWKEETALRRLSEIITFLHKRASADGVYYRLDFDYDKDNCSYRIHQLETTRDENIQQTTGMGYISIEIAGLQNPPYANEDVLIKPENFPSLAEPVELPNTMCFGEIKTMHGIASKSQPDDAYMIFSPQSFTEFAVVHLSLANEREVTILVNPFTGNTKIYREFKDFEWNYGR